MAEKKFIGIKKLWYADPIESAITAASLRTLLDTATEITNSHQDTFEYAQEDPEVTDYVNELSGKPYYRDATSEGAKTISFTIGEYDFDTKVALQGGKKSADGNVWESPENPEIRYKAIIAKTKTGNYVVFTNASIVGKTNMAEKNMGLGVVATAMDNPNDGVADEYWVHGEAVDTPAT